MTDLVERGDPLAFQDMCKARQEFLFAWRAWLKAGPSADATAAETYATGSAMTQLARLQHGE